MTDPFVEVIDEATLADRVAQLAAEITEDLGDIEPVVVGILRGSVPFLRDLSNGLPLRSEIDFLALTRFGYDGKVSMVLWWSGGGKWICRYHGSTTNPSNQETSHACDGEP